MSTASLSEINISTIASSFSIKVSLTTDTIGVLKTKITKFTASESFEKLKLIFGFLNKQQWDQAKEHWELPASQQRLVFEGRQLDDSKTLEELGIKGSSYIHLVLRSEPGKGSRWLADMEKKMEQKNQ